MASNISSALIMWSVLAPILLVIVHIALYRSRYRPLKGNSPQAFLARLILIFNAPILLVTWLIGWTEGRLVSEILLMMLFTFFTSNCITYAYFHVFNMSETARRIRMLVYLYERGGASAGDLRAVYSPTGMVAARLQRLVEMRQVACQADSRYRVSGRLLPWAASLVERVRHLLGFDRISL